MKPIFYLSPLVMALFVGGCASHPTTPKIVYPVTYQVQIGNTQVHSDYGPQNMNVEATQDVTVEAGRTLYYQVVSPIDVTVYVYNGTSPSSRMLLGQMQGNTFTSSIVPDTDALEFIFTASHPNTSGTLKFTLSDQPLPAAITSPPETVAPPPPS